MSLESALLSVAGPSCSLYLAAFLYGFFSHVPSTLNHTTKRGPLREKIEISSLSASSGKRHVERKASPRRSSIEGGEDGKEGKQY